MKLSPKVPGQSYSLRDHASDLDGRQVHELRIPGFAKRRFDALQPDGDINGRPRRGLESD